MDFTTPQTRAGKKFMSTYTDNYRLRYGTPTFQEQIEVAVITAASDIQNEDASTPDHANRLAWANWANSNSSVAWLPFAWPCSMNPAIQQAFASDPNSIKDSDVQFVVNSNLEAVIADWVANKPV